MRERERESARGKIQQVKTSWQEGCDGVEMIILWWLGSREKETGERSRDKIYPSRACPQ
jgi:hypothetical protein